MKHNKNSEEIKPWTHRQRQTSILFTHQEKQNNVIVKPFNNHNAIGLASTKIEQISRNKVYQEQTSMLQKRQTNNGTKMLNSKENHIRYSQIVPSYKVIRFQNNWPKRPKTKSNSKSKDKYTSFTSQSNRQHIEELFGQIKKQEMFKPEQKTIKARRYFTEQKDEDSIQNSTLAQRQPEVIKASKTQEVRKCQFAVKIIKKNKRIGGVSEQQLKRGKIYDKIQTMLDNSSKQGGHLSQMKRNYNIKKLLKLIKEEQS